MDGVKDHLIPHLAEKATAKEMWNTLKNLYEAKNKDKIMALKDKLHATGMEKGENVASYLTKMAQVKDELAVVGEVIADSELVRIALKGFTGEWDVFVKCVVGRKELPDWSRLWDNFTQEEIREESQSRDPDKSKDSTEDPNVALHVKGKGKKKKDVSKVRCFACQQKGHYAGQCPNKKKRKEEVVASESAAIVEFSKKFQEFSLMAYLGGIGCLRCNRNLAWFLDSGGSQHMTRMKNVFLNYSELDSRSFVRCGVSTRHVLVVKGVGSVKFQLELDGYLELTEVLYVPKVPMNILFISRFEMDGCGLMFHDGVVDLYPEGVRMERFYRLLGEPVFVRTSGWLDPNSDSD